MKIRKMKKIMRMKKIRKIPLTKVPQHLRLMVSILKHEVKFLLTTGAHIDSEETNDPEETSTSKKCKSKRKLVSSDGESNLPHLNLSLVDLHREDEAEVDAEKTSSTKKCKNTKNEDGKYDSNPFFLAHS